MNRTALWLAAMLAAATTQTARADTVPQLLNVPASYTPGNPFTFEVIAPGGENGFSAFNLDMTFSTNNVNPDLTLSASSATSQYVFSGYSTTGFTSSSTSTSLTASDSLTNPGTDMITTQTGVNDVLAVVTVSPGTSFTGPITVSFAGDTSVTYFTEGFDFPQGPVTIVQGAEVAAPVPTPAAWISMTIGGLILAARRQMQRKAVA
jgi:hypothetical protein